MFKQLLPTTYQLHTSPSCDHQNIFTVKIFVVNQWLRATGLAEDSFWWTSEPLTDRFLVPSGRKDTHRPGATVAG
jgi:hypothetical protein